MYFGYWLILGIVLIVLEIVIPSFVVIWFGIAALLTGIRVYARKAAVILARIATLYPEMDCQAWSKKGPYSYAKVRVVGKVLDMIWDNFLVDKLLRSYALVEATVRDDPEFLTFLKAKEACFPERRTCALRNLVFDDGNHRRSPEEKL